ncbi:MAG: hypothetical protein ACI9WU_000177 [Myxococcota bacterium]|jgi:hypothetical protein
MRWLLLAVLIAVVPLSESRASEPPKADVKAAKDLGRQARRMARKGQWGDASKLYAQAEELNPIFDYPWALADGHRDNGLLVLAWRALRRADSCGVPARKQTGFDRMLAEVEAELLLGFAFIELTDVPENADVRINGRQWLPPYMQWVDRNFSNIVVNHPLYIQGTFNWHHMKGKKHSRAVVLKNKGAFGRIRVTGSPDGAAVMIDDIEIGKLPSAQSSWIGPGEYVIKIQAGGEWLGHVEKAVVSAGKTTDVTIVLEPSQSDFEKLLASKKFWGWTFAGTGGALTITGAALLGVAGSRASDVEALNANHPGSVGNYADYSAQYDDTAPGISGMATGGHVMLWIGLAMAGTGTALLLLDRQDQQSAGEAMPPGSGWGAAATGAAPLVRF